MAVVLGPTFLEQPIEYRIDRINGNTVTRTWVGPKVYLDLIANAETPFAESMVCTGRGATYTLVARYINVHSGESGEIPTETQELDTAPVQQSIFFNPTFQALTAASQMLVRKVVDNRETRADAEAVFDTAVALGQMTAGEKTLALKAFDLIVMGAESYETHAFTLNRVRTASRKYPGSLTLTKAGSIWTTAELNLYVGNPLLFALPDLTLTAEETAKNLFAGWRQIACRVSDTSTGSRQMIEQWQLAKWSLDLYVRQDTIP